jgi:protein ImuB
MRARRIAVVWLPRLASERAMRRVRPDPACPFAVVAEAGARQVLACVSAAAAGQGLGPGMTLADARALCPGLATRPADPAADAAALGAMLRWAGRFSPLVGRMGSEALALDIGGVGHLFGGEAGLCAAISAGLGRAGFTTATGVADTPGAAWALARHGGGIAGPGATLGAIGALPPAALRIPPAAAEALGRLGLRRIADLAALPRAGLARRFGPEVVMRLDQALGALAEPISPEAEAPPFAARLSLPEPIGRTEDVAAGLGRLLERVCARLAEAGRGARQMLFEAVRVDGSVAQARVGLARPRRDAAGMAALLLPAIEGFDAGFGFERLRLEAVATEPMPPEQAGMAGAPDGGGATRRRMAVDDLVTRLGNRLGFEALLRLQPAESHIPERAFLTLAAAWAEPAAWPAGRDGSDRPLILFPPEHADAPPGAEPPARFRWRGRRLRTLSATGPERIAPEWWFDDPAWRSGVRDYWRVQTAEGPRLWLFHTPQAPGWAVQGEFA